MKRYKSSNLIPILSVLLLISVCMALISSTNAWFTTSGYNAIIDVKIGAINMKVLQGTTELDNKKSSYITLAGEILPDTQTNLSLNLKNGEASGTDGYYVRYKIEFLTGSSTGVDNIIKTNISGYKAQSSSSAGFVKDGNWFYYKNTAGTLAKYPGGQNLPMMTSFNIPYSSFVSGGNFAFNAECLKIKVTVQGSTTSTFEEVV